MAEYRAAQFTESFVGSNPDIHEFIWNGLQVSVIFYKDQAVFVEIHKLAYTLPFSDAEIQRILEGNPEGSPWHFEGGAWVSEHAPGATPLAIASVNANETSLTILNPMAMLERKLDKISSDFGKNKE